MNHKKTMASGLNWRERFLGTVGQVGKDIYHNVSAVTGVFAYVEVTDGLILPGGAVMDPEVWELLLDSVAANQNTVRMNYTDNPNITAADQFDYVLNAEGVDDATATNDTRAFFGGNTGVAGEGSFRAGTVNGTQWDTRGDRSAAFGQNTTALAVNSFVSGVVNTVNANATNGVILGGALNTLNDATDSAIVGGTFSTLQNATVANSVILGGANQLIEDNSSNCVIVAGNTNTIDNAEDACIVAGSTNTIQQIGGSDVFRACIFGGSSNAINGAGDTVFQCAILCGASNRIGPDPAGNPGPNNCTVVGGINNVIDTPVSESVESAIIAGNLNIMGGDECATVACQGSQVLNPCNNSVVVANNGPVTVPGGIVAGGSMADGAQCVIIGGSTVNVSGGRVNLAVLGVGGALDPYTTSSAADDQTTITQNLIVEGSVKYRAIRDELPVAITVDGDTDRVIRVNTSTGGNTVTLPDLSADPAYHGIEFYVINEDDPPNPFNNVTVATAGAALIDGAATDTLPADVKGHYIYDQVNDEYYNLNVSA